MITFTWRISPRKIVANIVLATMLVTQSFSGFLDFIPLASAASSITPATGGTNISIDTTSSGGTATWTTLGTIGGPTITENAPGDIAAWGHTLTLPAGWEFNTTQNVTIGVGGTSNIGYGGGVVTPGATTISFNIPTASTTGTAILNFSNIQVRPTGTVVGTGDITQTTGTIAGVTNSVTSFGTLSTIAGAINKICFTTQPSATVAAGVALATQPVIASQDQFGNTRTTDTATTTLSAFTNNLCTIAAVGTFAGTLTKAEVAGVADFVANGVNYQKVEGIYIKASDGVRTSCSSLITVTPGAAAVTINTQPVGGNSVDNALTTQPIVHVTDSFGNNVADGVTVTRSLVSGAGTLTGSITTVTAGGAGIATFAGLIH